MATANDKLQDESVAHAIWVSRYSTGVANRMIKVLNDSDAELIGRPFILGSHDCWGLVMDWHATQGVALNDFRVDYPWWESQYPDNLYFDNWQKEGFIECDPVPGCMVIMQVESDKWNHAGIITEEGELLHHLYGQPSCVTPYARGYFKDRTMICVRHKDLPQEIKPWRV